MTLPATHWTLLTGGGGGGALTGFFARLRGHVSGGAVHGAEHGESLEGPGQRHPQSAERDAGAGGHRGAPAGGEAQISPLHHQDLVPSSRKALIQHLLPHPRCIEPFSHNLVTPTYHLTQCLPQHHPPSVPRSQLLTDARSALASTS